MKQICGVFYAGLDQVPEQEAVIFKAVKRKRLTSAERSARYRARNGETYKRLHREAMRRHRAKAKDQ